MRVVQLSSDEKNVEILILRRQLDVMVRKNAQVIRLCRLERWSLAVLASALKKRGRLTISQLGNPIRIVKPDTVIKWHRQLVRRKWTQTPAHRGGRPPVDHELVDLIVRLAKENDRWGYGKISGELQKLGYLVSVSAWREECLDHILIWSAGHLRRVLNEFIGYYNTQRPRRGLDQQSPVTRTALSVDDPVACRHVLGGIINDYYRAPNKLAIHSV